MGVKNQNIIDEELQILENCNICPHECGANRFIKPSGYCRTGAGFYISSIVIHRGEEPVISGGVSVSDLYG